MAARRLADLYVVGKEVIFDDGEGDPVTVYVRKLVPAEHDKAMRQANGARSRLLSAQHETDGDLHDQLMGPILEMHRDEFIAYLVQDERYRKAPVVDAELAAEEAWHKDSYLDGLQEAWEGGLSDTYAQDPEDTEAKRVFSEMKRFTDEAEKALEVHLDSFAGSFEGRSDEALRQMVLAKHTEVQASIEWVNEMRKSEIWLSTREADRKTRVFNHRSEVDDLPTEVVQQLLAAYRQISVDPIEGKESGAKEASSASSDSPAKPATGDSSDQPAATA